MKIAVLYGGTSSERNVSLNSGTAMIQALARLGHEVLPLDAAFGRNQPKHESGAVGERPPAAEELHALPAAKNSENLFELIRLMQEEKVDLVVNGLHGGQGENGVVQALLEIGHLNYTGSGVTASAIAMDKIATKRLSESVGVPTPRYEFFRKDLPFVTAGKIIRERLSLPIVVKPNEDGSSVGLTIVREYGELEKAWYQAAEHGDVLVEAFIEGRELTVAVLGDEALPVVEIKPEGGVYDYHHKYTKGMTTYECPAGLTPEETHRLQDYALRVFNVTGCRGYARVDFRMNARGEFFCLEINTLPGMTGTSLVPKAAKAEGMEFEELMARIVELATT